MTKVWPLAASTSFGVIAASMSTGGKSCQARVMPLIQALESSKIRAAGIAVFSLVWGDMSVVVPLFVRSLHSVNVCSITWKVSTEHLPW